MGTGYGQFCPVAMACEVFARRWTPLILRELLSGAELFNDIHRGAPLISRALLAQRLRELAAAGVITIEPLAGGHGHRYRLTPAGEEFRPVLAGLGAWGQRWTARVEPRNLDPSLLVWNMRRRIALERLPGRRVVLQLRFGGVAPGHRGPRTFWLILDAPQVDLCVSDPGFEVDLYLEADLGAMASVWLGDLSFDSAVRARKVELQGPRELVRGFPSWWLLSPYAAVPRPSPTAAPAASRQRVVPAPARARRA